MSRKLKLKDIQNKNLQKLLSDFIVKANCLYWEADQGSMSSAEEAEIDKLKSEHKLVLYLNKLSLSVKKEYSVSSRKGCRTTSIEKKCAYYDYGKRKCVLNHTKDDCSLIKKNQKG